MRGYITLTFWFILALPCAVAAQQVRISDLIDMHLPLWVAGDPDIVEDRNVCIYRQNTIDKSRFYSLTALGGNTGFFLSAGRYRLPYTVQWNDGGATNTGNTGTPGAGTAHTVTRGQPLNQLNNARIDKDVPLNSSDCNGASLPTARLRVIIRAADLDAVPDGIYSGTLTLIVAPN